MSSALLGLLAMIIIFVTSLVVSAKSIATYIDPLSVLIVLGCTIGSAFMQYPARELKLLKNGFKFSLFGKVPQFSGIVRHLIEIAKLLKSGKPIQEIMSTTTDPLIKQGLSLIENELPLDRIYYILNQQIQVQQTEDSKVKDMFSTLGKLPPTFGMLGTVIGLVGLLESLGGDSGSASVGGAMAVALITTLYGLVISNFFLDPVANNLRIKQDHMLTVAKIILKGLILSADSTVTTIEVQEIMNAYLPEKEKVDVINI